MAGLVTLLTDFGTRDGYVGAVKGVLLARRPELRLVDIAHEIPPGDVAAAAWVLLQAAPHFPADTVHLAVVDPGVGSARRALAARVGDQFYVAPDNGLLTHVLDLSAERAVHEITSPLLAPPDASPVFHARDVFAPAAASLACGDPIHGVGAAVPEDALVRLVPEPRREGELLVGAVLHVDRFGNLIANLRVDASAGGLALLKGREVPLRRTYSDVAPGELVALRGSSGFLEVACNGGSAAEHVGAGRGDVIRLRVPQRS